MVIKKLNLNYIIGFITVLSIVVGFLTIQTFAGKGIFELNSFNIQILLILNLFFLSIFLSFILLKLFKVYSINKKENIIGAQTKNKFFFYFISLASVPSILVAIFSLLIFNFSIEKWFDKKINEVVKNSVEVAKRYLDEHQASIGKDILLIANDFNRNKDSLIKNKTNFEKYIKAQADVRNISDIFIINEKGDFVYSISNYDKKKFTKPDNVILSAAQKGKPVILSSAYTNKTYGIVKLTNFENFFLYVVQNVDPQIVSNLKKTGEASTYYFDIKNNVFNLQITFMIIYIIITLILIFLATIISINLSSYAINPIISLFNASNEIKKGNYNIFLDEKNLDNDFHHLYSAFNDMLKKIKDDQIKISLSGKFEAWNIIARKLAHEIKNPLTPIQLSLDRIKDKFISNNKADQKHFEDHMFLINSQIQEINSLLNSFSDFARMQEAVFETHDIIEIVNLAANPYIKNYLNIDFDIKNNLNISILKCDKNQIFRVFTNLIKNSIESIIEKNLQNNQGKITIQINEDLEYVKIELNDNGVGFNLKDINNIREPYFTSKKSGSGLGLSIVSKIIHEHGGDINFENNSLGGAKVYFTLKK